MSGKIYLISKDGEPKYVGFTSQSIEERWKEHCYSAHGKSKCILHKAIRKYGKEAFTIELVADYLNEDFALNVCEEFWIKHLGTHMDNEGYNMTWGSDKPPSQLGKTLSDETKRKLSEANSLRIGEKHPSFGKKHSDETKRKMSEAQRGEKNHQFGKKLSIERIVKRQATCRAKYDARVADEAARGTKRCTKCQSEKPFADFYKSAGKRNGLRSRCKDCSKR